MAPAAKPWNGRLVFWPGGNVWIGQVSSETGFHEHHAIQITLSLAGGAVRFREPDGDWASYAASIVASHQSHAFEAHDELVALIFTEPESRDGRALRDRYHQGVTPLSTEPLAALTTRLAAIHRQRGADDELADCARRVIAPLSSLDPAPLKPLDQRIDRALAAIRERLDDAITLADIADVVHLSPERFRHLFMEETGVRFRPYVLWLRMKVALAAYTAGSNLTDAAQTAGFADSAHFSRTFKRMFGVPAIEVQRA
jgi:AraC-like DNA-binding protein